MTDSDRESEGSVNNSSQNEDDGFNEDSVDPKLLKKLQKMKVNRVFVMLLFHASGIYFCALFPFKDGLA